MVSTETLWRKGGGSEGTGERDSDDDGGYNISEHHNVSSTHLCENIQDVVWNGTNTSKLRNGIQKK